MTILSTSDGLALEAVWSRPMTPPSGVVVLCHPDPRNGGTMNSPLIRSIAGRLVDAGLAVLRFNFRGVGASEGAWAGGEGELLDVQAAVEHTGGTEPDLPLHLAGWSFGAVMALRWQAATGDSRRYAGVAPPVSHDDRVVLPAPEELQPASRLFVLGTRDRFCTVEDLAGYAEAIGARFEVLEGSDHFFVFRDMEVGRLLAEHFLA